MTEAVEIAAEYPKSVGMREGEKSCIRCKEVLPRSAFYADRRQRDGLRAHCKTCHCKDTNRYRAENLEAVRARGRAAQKAYREANKEKIAAWEAAHRERRRETQAQWRKRNPDKLKAKHRRRYAALAPEKRREMARRQYLLNKQSPAFRIKYAVAGRINRSIRTGRLGQRTEALLGYTVQTLMEHLERQFLKGMSWENYGKWHIDHILPLSSFRIESYDSPDFKRAWALTNLRPLWGTDNVRKNAKITHLC